jgi:hypothetical protein
VQPLLQWRSNGYCTTCVCIGSLRYPACNVHTPYHLWPTPLYNIFPHYLINGTIFEKSFLNVKCVLRVSLHLLSEILFTLRRTERAVIEKVYCYTRPILRKLNFLGRFSKNSQISNLMKIRPVGAEVFHADGQTGGQ